MLQSHALVKGLFKLQDRTMGFNISEYKMFTVTVSYTTLELNFKKHHLLNFISVEEAKWIEDQGRAKEGFQL